MLNRCCFNIVRILLYLRSLFPLLLLWSHCYLPVLPTCLLPVYYYSKCVLQCKLYGPDCSAHEWISFAWERVSTSEICGTLLLVRGRGQVFTAGLTLRNFIGRLAELSKTCTSMKTRDYENSFGIRQWHWHRCVLPLATSTYGPACTTAAVSFAARSSLRSSWQMACSSIVHARLHHGVADRI